VGLVLSCWRQGELSRHVLVFNLPGGPFLVGPEEYHTIKEAEAALVSLVQARPLKEPSSSGQ